MLPEIFTRFRKYIVAYNYGEKHILAIRTKIIKVQKLNKLSLFQDIFISIFIMFLYLSLSQLKDFSFMFLDKESGFLASKRLYK